MPRPLHILSILVLAFTSAALPSHQSARASGVLLTDFPTLRQQHRLTCEASAASMGTRARVTESQIMAMMGRDPNPNLGFRGNPDRDEDPALNDYGVYAAPVHAALLRLGYGSDHVMYGTDRLLRTYIDRGWPVIAWVTYQLQRSTPRFAWANGSQFFLVPHEHAVLIVGYDGATVTANDPWIQARVRYTWPEFNRSWGYFGRMALAVEPCALPQAVTGLRPVGVSPSSLTWRWKPAVNAVSYHVRVIRHGKQDRVVFDGVQSDHVFSLGPPDSRVGYEIVITSLSSCGGVSAPQSLWTWVSLPTVTPTPGEFTPVPTGTATPSPTSTSVGALTARPTPSPTSGH